MSETSVACDATAASAEKSRIWAEATIDNLVRFMDDFRWHPIKSRRNFNYLFDEAAEKDSH